MPLKNHSLRCIAAVAAATVLAAGNNALAGVADTAHNLSSSADTTTQTIYSSTQGEICVFCHTPHNALKNENIPLWNHELSTQTYGVYGSPTFDATDIAAIDSTGETDATVSNLCMSCHDGTIAINSFENPSNAYPTTTMVGTDAGDLMPAASSANLGTNLGDDHPVNFTYDSALALADGSLADPATDGVGDAKLFNGKVQCASCHDPHESTKPTFLRASMAGSELCLDCHVK